MTSIEILFAIPLIMCFLNIGTCKEFCLWELFKPECSSNELVLINQAKYGRMNFGKCLAQSEVEIYGAQSKDPRFFGCHNDFSQYLTDKCSFVKNCEVKVIDLEKLKNEACLPGLKMYLEVDYSCLPVIDQFDGCHVYLTTRPKYLALSYIDITTCGSSKKPMIIEAPKGQKVKITYKILGKSNFNGINDDGLQCHDEIGVIIDKKSNNNITICQNGFLPLKAQSSLETVLESKETFLSMILYSPIQAKQFLLELKAEGCLDIIPPEDTWLKRNGDEIVIGCYSSKQTWYLRCENGQWVGTIGNCSNPGTFGVRSEGLPDHLGQNEVVNAKLDLSPTHQTLIITAISGFGLVVCLAIVCMGAMCLRRMNYKDNKTQAYYNIGPNCQSGSMYKQPDHFNRKPGFNDSLATNGRQGQHYMGGSDEVTEDGRYQVLDKDEVAKENQTFA